MKSFYVFALILSTMMAGSVKGASLAGTWAMNGWDATTIVDPFIGGYIYSSVRHPFTNMVNEERSGPVRSGGYTSGPEDWGVQRLAASGNVYGDLKVLTYVSNTGHFEGQRHQGSAQVDITWTDKARFLFKPTLARPTPEPVQLHYSLSALLERDFVPWAGSRLIYNASTSVTVGVPLEGSTGFRPILFAFDGEYLDTPHSGPSYSRLAEDSTTISVLPQYVLPANPQSPFLVTYDFSVQLSGRTDAYGAVALADSSHTLRLDSITFADGTIPESYGYQIEFESGNISPNLRPVPEPDSLVLAAMCLVYGYAFVRTGRPSRLLVG